MRDHGAGRRADFLRVLVALEGELGSRLVRHLATHHLGPMSHREIGIVMGLAHASVQRIEERALRKMRSVLAARGIRSGDL